MKIEFSFSFFFFFISLAQHLSYLLLAATAGELKGKLMVKLIKLPSASRPVECVCVLWGEEIYNSSFSSSSWAELIWKIALVVVI